EVVAFEAKRFRLDQRRTAALARTQYGGAARLPHGRGIVSINGDGGHVVALTADRDVGNRRSVFELGMFRTSVVMAEEDDRKLPHGREIESFVKCADVARPIAEIGDRDPILTTHLACPG